MRPSDENQDKRMHAQPRPNLMSSSRRGGHEDSILAKLEREPARRGASGNGARLAWYGSAAVLALGLTATLAWLAAGTGPAPLGVAQSDHAPLPAPSAPPALVPVPAPTALIVDAAPEPALAAAPPAPPPPLRLLEPAVAQATQAAPARPTPAPPKAAALRRAEPRVATSARPRVQAAPGRATPRQAARAARTVNPARPGEAQEDSDIALISAVIYHANGHATPDEAEAPAACTSEPCRTRPTR